MRDFKIGEKVRVKEWNEMAYEFKSIGVENIKCGDLSFIEEMRYLCGQTLTVEKNNLNDDRHIEVVDKNEETWEITPNMVHFLNEYIVEVPIELKENQLLFAKSKEGAKIPTKTVENAGYDVYSCFEEDYIVINPSQTIMISTGIHSAFSPDYYAQLQERGSTGTKGMAQRAGVIDSGYRGEWMIPITNTTNYFMMISKLSEEETIKKEFKKFAPVGVIVYPYEKAICQAVVLPVPKMNVSEVTLEELKSIASERGEGKLGSSNK